MQIEGTKAAFDALINQKGFAKNYGYHKATVSGWKSREITLNKMEEVLKNCGALILTDTIWIITL